MCNVESLKLGLLAWAKCYDQSAPNAVVPVSVCLWCPLYQDTQCVHGTEDKFLLL